MASRRSSQLHLSATAGPARHRPAAPRSHSRASTRICVRSAKALGVKHILEGSVRKAGDQLRITAQLVDAGDGSRGYGPTRMTRNSATFSPFRARSRSPWRLRSAWTLSAGDSDISRGGTRNVEAYDAWLAGRAIIASGTPDDKRRGIEQLERAVALDPGVCARLEQFGRDLSERLVTPRKRRSGMEG